jgi:hypothetical protein
MEEISLQNLFSLDQIILRQLNQGGWDGNGTEGSKKCITFLIGKPVGKRTLARDTPRLRIILNWILKK